MAILSPLTRTIKCLLAALLAHACTVRSIELYDFPTSTPSATQNGGGSWWFSGSATPTAAPVSSSGGGGSWLPPLPSWLSGSGSSSATQSSSSGQSSFSPSATQLAIGAAGAAAASLTTYYLYNLYQKFNKQYEATEKYYRPILNTLNGYIGLDQKPTADTVPTDIRDNFLKSVASKQCAYKIVDLNQFKEKLIADMQLLSPLKWAEVRAPLYSRIVTPTKVAALKGELRDLLHYVDSLLEAEQKKLQGAQKRPISPQRPEVALKANIELIAPQKQQTAELKKLYETFNALLSDDSEPKNPRLPGNPWSSYRENIKNAIVNAKLSRNTNFEMLLNIINNNDNMFKDTQSSHQAFSLFIESQKSNSDFIEFVKANPDILDKMPPVLSKQLQEKLTKLDITLSPTPKQAIPQPASAPQDIQKEAHLDRASKGA